MGRPAHGRLKHRAAMVGAPAPGEACWPRAPARPRFGSRKVQCPPAIRGKNASFWLSGLGLALHDGPGQSAEGSYRCRSQPDGGHAEGRRSSRACAGGCWPRETCTRARRPSPARRGWRSTCRSCRRAALSAALLDRGIVAKTGRTVGAYRPDLAAETSAARLDVECDRAASHVDQERDAAWDRALERRFRSAALRSFPVHLPRLRPRLPRPVSTCLSALRRK